MRPFLRLLLGGAALASAILVFLLGVNFLWGRLAPAFRAGQFSPVRFFLSHADNREPRALARRATQGKRLLREGAVSGVEGLLEGVEPSSPLDEALSASLKLAVRANAEREGNGGESVLSLIADGRFGSALRRGYLDARKEYPSGAYPALEPGGVADALFQEGLREDKEPRAVARLALAISARLKNGRGFRRRELHGRWASLPGRREWARPFARLLGHGVAAEAAATGGRQTTVLEAVSRGEAGEAVRLAGRLVESGHGPASQRFEYRRAMALVILDALGPGTYPEPAEGIRDLRLIWIPIILRAVRVEFRAGKTRPSRMLGLLREGRFGEIVRRGRQLAQRAGMAEDLLKLKPARVARRLFEYGLVGGKAPPPLAALCLWLAERLRVGGRAGLAELREKYRALPPRRSTPPEMVPLFIYGAESEVKVTNADGTEVIEAVARKEFRRALRLGSAFAGRAGMRKSVLGEFRDVERRITSGSLKWDGN